MPADRLAGRTGQAGVTRRGFPVVGGLAAAVLVAGGFAWRAAPWRDWLGATGDAVGVDVPSVTHVTRRDFRAEARFIGRAFRQSS